MKLLVENRLRDEQGRFIESSEFDKTSTSARLHKGYKDRLANIARKKGLSTAELVRKILEDYVRKNEEDSSTK